MTCKSITSYLSELVITSDLIVSRPGIKPVLGSILHLQIYLNCFLWFYSWSGSRYNLVIFTLLLLRFWPLPSWMNFHPDRQITCRSGHRQWASLTGIPLFAPGERFLTINKRSDATQARHYQSGDWQSMALPIGASAINQLHSAHAPFQSASVDPDQLPLMTWIPNW
jgi:hypothetical protein